MKNSILITSDKIAKKLLAKGHTPIRVENVKTNSGKSIMGLIFQDHVDLLELKEGIERDIKEGARERESICFTAREWEHGEKQWKNWLDIWNMMPVGD